MPSLVEQLATGVFRILSRADDRLTAYQHNRRGRMRLQEADRSEIEASIAVRAEARERTEAALEMARQRSTAQRATF
jgi:hypothetical protein